MFVSRKSRIWGSVLTAIRCPAGSASRCPRTWILWVTSRLSWVCRQPPPLNQPAHLLTDPGYISPSRIYATSIFPHCLTATQLIPKIELLWTTMKIKCTRKVSDVTFRRRAVRRRVMFSFLIRDTYSCHNRDKPLHIEHAHTLQYIQWVFCIRRRTLSALHRCRSVNSNDGCECNFMRGYRGLYKSSQFSALRQAASRRSARRSSARHGPSPPWKQGS